MAAFRYKNASCLCNFIILKQPITYHLQRAALVLVLFLFLQTSKAFAQTLGTNDTITMQAVVYNGDTLMYKPMVEVIVYCHRGNYYGGLSVEEWTRLRNAVYVTYPYARKAGVIMNDINANLVGITNKSERSKYIKSREAELKKEFTDPLTNLSVYQGKVLMKLINRETGNNCYEIIKEYKSGMTARFWQTVAFFFGSNLKQPYEPTGEDAVIERIVREVQRMYGWV